MGRLICNLHNHTPFSAGAYSIDELCEAHLAARSVRFDGIGISDHLFCTPTSREISSEKEFQRVFAAEVRDYVEQVHAARRRWAGKLHVFCGCEINWPLNKQWLGTIRGLLNGIDYVLFEFVDWAGLTQLANQVRRWPCPVGLSNTEVARRFPNTSMDQVVRTMANARIFYEFNTAMLPLESQGPWLRILPKHRVAVSLGSDTHDDLRCIEEIGQVLEGLRRAGLEEKLLALKPREQAASDAPQKTAV